MHAHEKRKETSKEKTPKT